MPLEVVFRNQSSVSSFFPLPSSLREKKIGFTPISFILEFFFLGFTKYAYLRGDLSNAAMTHKANSKSDTHARRATKHTGKPRVEKVPIEWQLQRARDRRQKECSNEPFETSISMRSLDQSQQHMLSRISERIFADVRENRH